MSETPLDTVTFKFTEGELIDILALIEFCDGGPHRMEEERKELEYKFRKALDDHFPGWDEA